MNDDSPWRRLGAELAAHRMRMHPTMSKRAAAAAAGFSESTWRQLEDGVRKPSPGIEVEMSARPETVYAAAVAVDMDPTEALAIVGMEMPGLVPVKPPAVDDKVDQLLAAVMRTNARLDAVVSLLEAQAGAGGEPASPPSLPSPQAADRS